MSEFRDIESTNMYRILLERGKTEEEAFEIIKERSRDNSRTPMLWDNSPQAGFTTGTPWIKVDERYPQINVEQQLSDPDSIFHHYRKLISFRKEIQVFTDGDYKRLDEGHPQIYSYSRSNSNEMLIVISNFSGDEAQFELPEALWQSLDKRSIELQIGNTGEDKQLSQRVQLSPYASYMWLIR